MTPWWKRGQEGFGYPDPCPYCKATKGQPCKTKSGGKAAVHHGRPRIDSKEWLPGLVSQAVDLFGEKDWTGVLVLGEAIAYHARIAEGRVYASAEDLRSALSSAGGALEKENYLMLGVFARRASLLANLCVTGRSDLPMEVE